MLLFGIDILEWVGYLASVLILVSLLMSSIIKLRWINLLGCIVFSIYGLMIGALPVGISNLIIGMINIYYLARIYSAKEYFKILPVETDSDYLNYFLTFYQRDIHKFFSQSVFPVNEETIGFFIVRNAVPAGVFLASKKGLDSLLIELDYAVPEYRDLKTGRYVYEKQRQYFLDKGYNRLYSYAYNQDHVKYLKKMGFFMTKEEGKEIYIKILKENG